MKAIAVRQPAQLETLECLDLGVWGSNGTVKALIELGLILQGPKIGRSHSYCLNPQFGWKGTVNNHKKALTNGLSVIQGSRALT
ncbi:hypothetical protein [Xenorhabdus aichiensis]|uniref:hypothetical protein n=1 Tax=Xenorhabdus aichiensis TaxID=3025874 RepID=UPI00235969E8|nr:hypothetical protein [Xenorhabdus aichiensis]